MRSDTSLHHRYKVLSSFTLNQVKQIRNIYTQLNWFECEICTSPYKLYNVNILSEFCKTLISIDRNDNTIASNIQNWPPPVYRKFQVPITNGCVGGFTAMQISRKRITNDSRRWGAIHTIILFGKGIISTAICSVGLVISTIWE